MTMFTNKRVNISFKSRSYIQIYVDIYRGTKFCFDILKMI